MLCDYTLSGFSSLELEDRHRQTGRAWPGRGKPFSLALDRLMDQLDDSDLCHGIHWPASWDIENRISEDIPLTHRGSKRPYPEELDLEAIHTVGARGWEITSQTNSQSRLIRVLL